MREWSLDWNSVRKRASHSPPTNAVKRLATVTALDRKMDMDRVTQVTRSSAFSLYILTSPR
jgi:hypothetical protein